MMSWPAGLPHIPALVPLAALVLAMLAHPPRGAAALEALGTHTPPYVVERDGLATGPGGELLAELMRSAGYDPVVRAVPHARLFRMLATEPVVATMVWRLPQREDALIWIAPIIQGHILFGTRRGQPPLDSLDAARHVGGIGVLAGSVPHLLLLEAGYDNIQPEPAQDLNARKLASGRIDAWLVGRMTGRAIWRDLGYDPAQVTWSVPVFTSRLWIVGGKALDPAMIAGLRRHYDQMMTDGRYDRIIAPLR
jgi:polar amino acid transport system substrate-binding protein